MKTDKLVAILVVSLAFEIFFLLGVFYIQPLTKTVEHVVYINQSAPGLNLTTGASISVYGIGVYEDNATGELVEVRISLLPGTGKTYVDTTFHAYGTDLQDSMYSIKSYAERFTGKSIGNYDLYLRTFSVAHSIQGTSGSATMTIGLIALIENKSIRDDMVMTGTLLSDGRIGPIESLNSKIKIAKNYGMKVILVPNSECADVTPVDGIEIDCVKTIQEAVDRMIV